MKKLLLVVGVAGLFAMSSCSKCGTCSGSGSSLDGEEYCKGNIVEDAAYNAAESSCESLGGTFGK